MKVLRPITQTYPMLPCPSVFPSWLHRLRFRAPSHFPSLQAGVNPDLPTVASCWPQSPLEAARAMCTRSAFPKDMLISSHPP